MLYLLSEPGSEIQLKVPKFTRSVSYQEDSALVLHDVSASWTGDPNMMALKNISMRLRKGKLCAIIGAVGSGKVMADTDTQ